MKKAKLLIPLTLFSLLTSCSGDKYLELRKFKSTDQGFQDLGNYVIQLDEYKSADFNAAKTYFEKKYEIDPASVVGISCTACAKLNEKGEVLIGRNLDNQVSECNAFFLKTSFGKYDTISLRYMNSESMNYEQFKNADRSTDDYKSFINSIPFAVTDSMNEKGLYVQANVREPQLNLCNSGTNPGKEKVYTNMLVGLIAMNCATVKDVLSYLRNDINIVSTPYLNNFIPTQYAYYVGDATGEFGVIEIAQNEIVYLPYQSAQANYYLYPKFNQLETSGSGVGRYMEAIRGLEDVDDQEEMLEHMKQPMWCREVLDMEYSYQDESGKAHFVDKDGNPSIDYRSDFSTTIPLNENFEYAPELQEDLVALSRSTTHWMQDDKNFPVVKEVITSRLNNLKWKEKLLKYYAGDETELRKDGQIFTTGASFAVNCKKKSMIIKLFEKENLTYEIKL